MKSGIETATKDGEKHSLGNLFITLIDRTGKILWATSDPTGSRGVVGRSGREFCDAESYHIVTDALRRCVVDSETVVYFQRAKRITGENRLWHTTMMPMAIPGLSPIAACAISRIVPDNYFDFTDDEKGTLRMLADDLTLKEIAAEMHRSESAIDARIKILKDKLGCKNLAGLVGAAIRKGVI